MKTISKIVFSFSAACFLAAATLNVSAGPVGIAPGRLLVQPKPGTPEVVLEQVFRSLGARAIDDLPQIQVRVLQVPDRALHRVMTALQNNPNIHFAEPDFLLAPDAIVNDPYFSSQWHLSKIQAPSGWKSTAGSSNLKIAIIDTGVEATHPDLKDKLLSGWNFYSGNSDTSDVHGHGTAVAGTAAAAANNGVGVASVAFGAAILPIRVTDDNGYAYESTIAKAVNWAADQGSRVANISFRVSNSSTIKSAARYFQSKGGVVVVSSGNDGLFDSAADNPYVLTVSATDSNDAITSWSNTGNNIDLAAPGLYILTTHPGAGYSYWSGTSFSAPVVAGAAALVLSANPTLSGVEAADILKKSADDVGAAGWDTQYGAGRVNVSRAVSMASAVSNETSPSDIIAPVIIITSPSEGARVGNNTSVYVNAADNVRVTKVELYVNGRLTASSTSAPFTTKWNSRTAAKGAHKLQTRALDAAGNSGWSQVVTVYR